MIHPPHSLYDTLPAYSQAHSPETRLWRAVVMQALSDIRASKGVGLHGNHALSWVLYPSRDFSFVCDLAGYDPHFIRRTAKKLVQGIEFCPPLKKAHERTRTPH